MGYSELQQKQDILSRHRENRGRMASASCEFTTTGVGVVEFEDRIDFDILFIDKPRFHYGSEVNADDLRVLADIPDTDPLPLPICSGSVTEWDQDENEHYRGAWVAVYVSAATADPIEVIHHLDFVGVGLKVIPTDPDD